MEKVTIKRRNESERADGRAALYAVLNIERIKIRLPLDDAVTAGEWYPVAERIKGRGQEVKDNNSELQISDITPEWLQVHAAHLRKHHNNPGTIRKNIQAGITLTDGQV